MTSHGECVELGVFSGWRHEQSLVRVPGPLGCMSDRLELVANQQCCEVVLTGRALCVRHGWMKPPNDVVAS